MIKKISVAAMLLTCTSIHAYDVCNDRKAFTEESLDFIRANYCNKRKKDNGRGYYYFAQRPFRKMCWGNSDCHTKVRSAFFTQVSNDRKINQLAFNKSPYAATALADMRTQLGNNFAQDGQEVLQGLHRSYRNAQNPGLDQLEQEYGNTTQGREAIRLLRVSDEAKGRQAILNDLIKDYKSKGIPVPQEWSNLANGPASAVTPELNEAALSQYRQGIAAYQHEQTARLESQQAAVERSVSASSIREVISSAEQDISDKLSKLVKEKCGEGALGDEQLLGQCAKDKPELQARLSEASAEFQRLAEASNDLDDALKDENQTLSLLLMSKELFDAKYGASASKKVLDEIKNNVLGDMMHEIACAVKSTDNVCNSVIGNKSINGLYLNNQKLNGYFNETRQIFERQVGGDQ